MPSKAILDHGQIELVAFTATTDNDSIIDFIGDTVRVSYGNHRITVRDRAKTRKLLSRLIADKHTSPFEHVSFTFYVKAPIFVMRQWMRHRTMSYSEVSLRYTEAGGKSPDQFYTPNLLDIGVQDVVNKQARDRSQHNPQADDIVDLMRYAYSEAITAYRGLIATGAPRELARNVLPVGLYTETYITANLLNWVRFLALRVKPDAQFEIREYAIAIRDILDDMTDGLVSEFLVAWGVDGNDN